MSFGSTVSESSSSTLVDSAEAGSQDDASLFWTSMSLAENVDITPAMSSATTTTIHLVTRPVNLPAICRCMRELHHEAGPVGIRDFPDLTVGDLEIHLPFPHRSGPVEPRSRLARSDSQAATDA